VVVVEVLQLAPGSATAYIARNYGKRDRAKAGVSCDNLVDEDTAKP
jgi:hypothetical protein